MTTSSIADQILQRKLRGAKIVANCPGNVSQVSHFMYLVRGSESPQYTVTFTDGPSCECQDFARHGAALHTCKHLEAARVFNAAWCMIDRDGEQVTTLRAVVEASTGSELHRKRWEAVLSILRLRAAHTSAAVPVRRMGPQTPQPAPMPPLVDLRDYYPTAA